jgi:predicted nucleic acid-binding protein
VPSFLLDTDVISALMTSPGHRRRQRIEAWMRSLGDASVILSSVSIAEINRGIALVGSPAIAASISRSLDAILSIYPDAVITPSHAEWQSFARLSAVPELRHLCHGRNKRNLPRTGADVFLAIQAATSNCAIATYNVPDFRLVDRHMPLGGGLIDAATGAWAIEPDAVADGHEPDSGETFE